ncbi:MAG: deoxyribose-phosphate aldolase [Nocardioides sp.]|uniref:deoxyribose-phosphate aldolase n=1 Tax=Nocardioides sp. TaxID=35761 RepID=UPI0039E366A5
MSVETLAYPVWTGRLPTMESVAKMIDHSLLRPELGRVDIDGGLATAVEYRVASVCVRPADVAYAAERLAGTGVAVGTVVAFPHGSSTSEVKVYETERVIAAGADEIDMVVNIGRLRDGDAAFTESEIRAVVEAAAGRCVKVIFENSYLDDDQKVAGYLAAERAGAHFVKTSTGFAAGGATAHDIALMRATVAVDVAVKAAGGVRSLDALLELNRLGATRFGATATGTILDDLAARLAGHAPVAASVAPGGGY